MRTLNLITLVLLTFSSCAMLKKDVGFHEKLFGHSHQKESIVSVDLKNTKVFNCNSDSLIIETGFDWIQEYHLVKSVIECYAEQSYVGNESQLNDLENLILCMPNKFTQVLFGANQFKFRGESIFALLWLQSNNHECINGELNPGLSHFDVMTTNIYNMIRSIDGVSVKKYLNKHSNDIWLKVEDKEPAENCFSGMSRAIYLQINSALKEGKVELKSFQEE